jgi:NADH:ubiquinone oxidoreductase subunit D
MRDILEELPNALMPDLALQSEAPGVVRVALDDDLVRPVAEDELRQDSGRSRRSPLAKQVELTIDAHDPSLSTSIGLRLGVEGLRVRAAAIEIGNLHTGLERHAVGARVDDSALFSRLGALEPALVFQLAVCRAVERLGDFTPSPVTTSWRQVALDLVCAREHAQVIADTARRVPRLRQQLMAVVTATSSALAGIVIGERLAAPFSLRAAIPDDERATFARRLDDVHTAIAAVDTELVERIAEQLNGAGVLSLVDAIRFGIDGPTLQAAGGADSFVTDDARRPVLPNLPTSGCAGARVRVRLLALGAAVQRAAATFAVVDRTPPAPEPVPPTLATLTGTADALIAGASGTVCCVVDIVGGVVKRLRLRPAELPVLAVLPATLRGVLLDDVADVIATFGLRASAIDR